MAYQFLFSLTTFSFHKKKNFPEMIAFSNNVVFFNLLIFLQRLLSPIVQFNTIDILTLNI